MGNVFQTFTLRGMQGEKKVRGLIDSGAEFSAIRPDIALSIGAAYNGNTIVRMANGTKVNAQIVSLNLFIRDRYQVLDAISMKMKEPLIIGQDFLQRNNAQIDFSKDKLIFNMYAPRARKIYRI